MSKSYKHSQLKPVYDKYVEVVRMEGGQPLPYEQWVHTYVPDELKPEAAQQPPAADASAPADWREDYEDYARWQPVHDELPPAAASARECQHGNDPAQCEECTPHEADEPVININGRDLTEDQADTAIRQIAERAARDGQEG